MSVEQYAVRQDGLFVAKVDINPTDEGRQRAWAEASHYMLMYGQDAPAQLWHRSKHRKWKPLTGCGFVSPDEVERMRAFANQGMGGSDDWLPPARDF